MWFFNKKQKKDTDQESSIITEHTPIMDSYNQNKTDIELIKEHSAKIDDVAELKMLYAMNIDKKGFFKNDKKIEQEILQLLQKNIDKQFYVIGKEYSGCVTGRRTYLHINRLVEYKLFSQEDLLGFVNSADDLAKFIVDDVGYSNCYLNNKLYESKSPYSNYYLNHRLHESIYDHPSQLQNKIIAPNLHVLSPFLFKTFAHFNGNFEQVSKFLDS